MSEKADNVEQAEQKVLELWARWEGKVFDGRIDYPDDFSIRDIERDLQNVISARGAAVKSATFDKELQRRIVRAVLPKTDEATLMRIGDEIEAGSMAGRL
ncbi:MAG: hypothetical protein A2V53_02550 [Deltaproteobacteria bacterium RBG_19FT_COMBO_56_10]|nr:MAG: hypothetical protein A2V53_02550 [Deltaproteobacteria bacterium RBG_19FT_COMBO_56_10]